MQGWVHYPMDYDDRKWVAVPAALYGRRAAGPQQIATVMYPIPPDDPLPIVSIRKLSITSTDGKLVSNAIALEIVFRNGTRQQIMHAPRAGIVRRIADIETDQAILIRESDANGQESRRIELDPAGDQQSSRSG